MLNSEVHVWSSTHVVWMHKACCTCHTGQGMLHLQYWPPPCRQPGVCRVVLRSRITLCAAGANLDAQARGRAQLAIVVVAVLHASICACRTVVCKQCIAVSSGAALLGCAASALHNCPGSRRRMVRLRLAMASRQRMLSAVCAGCRCCAPGMPTIDPSTEWPLE